MNTKRIIIIFLAGILILAGFWSGGVVIAQNSTSTQPGTEGQTDDDDIEALKKKIEEQEKTLKELRRKASEQERNIEQAQSQASSLQNQISRFNGEVAFLESRIAVKEQEISSTQLAIRKVILEIEKKQNEINKTKTHMGSLFQEIYESDRETTLEMVFKYESLSGFFGQVQARKSLQESIVLKLGELKELKEELEEGKKTLDEKKEELLSEQKQLRDQKLVLDRRRVQHRQLLQQTKEQESQYQEVLSDIQEKEQEIRREIFELEDQLRRRLDPDSVPGARPGVLAWPTEGLITQGYGCIHTSWARRSYPACDGGSGGFHNGIDIAAAFGTPIRTADDGRVVAINNSPYAYGYWVAVEHSNGLVTAYTHMSPIRPVSVGDAVERGQLVGYMDSTGYSTGSHTHFMVYAPDTFRTKPSRIAGVLPIGATLNPFDYLP